MAISDTVQPPVLLAGIFAISLVIAFLSSLSLSIIVLCSVLIIFLFCAPNKGKVPGSICKANFFIIFIWLVVPFTTTGLIVWQYGFLSISLAGLKLCILITLKANAILLLFLTFIAPMSVFDFGKALAQLRWPPKLAWLFILMEKNIVLLESSWQKLNVACKLRGFSPKFSWHTYKIFGAMIGLILIKAHIRGVALQEAMLLAGFDGRLPFDKYFNLNFADKIFMAVICLCTVILVVSNYYI